MTVVGGPRRDAKWWGWGDPSISPRLDDEALGRSCASGWASWSRRHGQSRWRVRASPGGGRCRGH